MREDYEKVNDVLADVETEIRRSFLDELEQAVDDHLAPVGHLVSSWSIDKARDIAWVNVQTLWELQRVDSLFDTYADGLARTVGMGSRLLWRSYLSLAVTPAGFRFLPPGERVATGMTQTDGLLFDPNTYDPEHFDAETRRLLRATIDFFEGQGKKRILDDDLRAQWPADFVEFVKREKLFATFLTPSEFADGNPDKRWDAARNAALAEILGFYGLTYWYTEQVTILGLGPVWQSENKDAKLKAADDLEAGQVMAFGLSEREHGADVYSTDLVLTPASEEDRANGILYRASGEKYYIGNGNVASLVSVFGRREETEGEDAYVFFAADSRHENYHLIDNVVHMQIYVSTFRLENYPVRAEDILHTGVEAFAAALNTVNVGKFNLCSASIGMAEHAFYEAITHAQNRILYGNPVTDFSHVRANFVDSYARLVAMKPFSRRAVDYFRSASLEDRRYLLFNPMTKAKVTMEGETVDAVAA